MNAKLFLIGVVALVTLPSCMHPVDQVLHANAEAKQQCLESNGTVSQGACDDIGQYIARNTNGDRLTMQQPLTYQQAAAYLMSR